MSRLAGPLSAARQACRRRASPGAVILGYHDVTAPGGRATGLSVSASDLVGHIRMIRRLGLQIVPLREISDRLQRGETVDGLAALTFDDALEGVHRYGLAVLDQMNVSATIFVVTEDSGLVPSWWPEMPRTLNDAEVEDLVRAGHEVGSHTRTHRSLPSLAPNEVVEELERSRHQLEERTGAPVSLLAYPSGHHDSAVRDAARVAGYEAAVTFMNGRVTDRIDPFRLPRLTMGDHMSPPRLAYHLLRAPNSWPNHQLDSVGPAARRGPPTS